MKPILDKLIFYLSLIAFIIILVFTILSFYFLEHSNIPYFLQIFVKYHIFFMFAIGILGIIFGSYTQIISNRKIEKNNEKIKQIKNLYLTTINNEYKQILNYLINNNGNCTQYELTKLKNTNKLKISRTLDEMEKKKIIKKERIGKINKIYLNSQILEILK